MKKNSYMWAKAWERGRKKPARTQTKFKSKLERSFSFSFTYLHSQHNVDGWNRKVCGKCWVYVLTTEHRMQMDDHFVCWTKQRQTWLEEEKRTTTYVLVHQPVYSPFCKGHKIFKITCVRTAKQSQWKLMFVECECVCICVRIWVRSPIFVCTERNMPAEEAQKNGSKCATKKMMMCSAAEQFAKAYFAIKYGRANLQ